VLYEQARLTRLGTDKFMIDAATPEPAGGNHVVLAHVSCRQSVLRRPDLLKSLVLYGSGGLALLFLLWFVHRPTSQAPRLDEARLDILYELEIATAMVPPPGQGEAPRPWLVDRLFAIILVDVTGNTHRRSCASTSCSRPTGRPGGSAWSSSARSRWPPTRE